MKTLLAGTSFMLASFSAVAVTDYTCGVECAPVPTFDYTTEIYNLFGSANVYDVNGDSVFPTMSATGTITYNTWYNLETGEGGEDISIDINGLSLDGAQFVDAYSWRTGSTGLVTDYVEEEFDFYGETVLVDSTVLSEWNYIVGGGLPASVYTLDNNLDGISGVRAYILGGSTAVTIDYQLSQVPVPAAVWLFGSGLLMLVGVVRRRQV